MKKSILKIELPSELESISQIRRILKRSLDYLNLTDSFINNCLLASSEIATNYIEHNNALHSLSLSISASSETLELQLVQNGSQDNEHELKTWIDKIHAAQNNEIGLDTLMFNTDRSGGRGAELLAMLVEDIQLIPCMHDNSNVSSQSSAVYRSGLQLNWLMRDIKIKERVLIVDDDIALATLYANYLADFYDVSQASSTKEALDKVEKSSFDFILSDIHMPGEDGVQLRRYLFEQKNAAQTSFIFLSGDKNAETSLGISRLGIDGFLVKPITKEKLLSELVRIRTRHHQLQKLNDLDHTRSITASLNPNLPESAGGWKFAHAFESAGKGGGDLIIYKKYASSIMIVIADLMGHDVAAKFFSHAYLGYIRGVLCASKPRPEVFLTLLSEALYSDELLSQSMCTCCAVELRPGGKITVASAGHPPPHIISKHSITSINAGGMLPGLMPGIVYSSVEHNLKRGERLAIFTDGFLDTSLQGGNNPDQSLLEALTHSLNAPIDVAVESAFSQSIDMRCHQEIDDAALVMAEPTLI